jgi:hypothetical protein
MTKNNLVKSIFWFILTALFINFYVLIYHFACYTISNEYYDKYLFEKYGLLSDTKYSKNELKFLVIIISLSTSLVYSLITSLLIFLIIYLKKIPFLNLIKKVLLIFFITQIVGFFSGIFFFANQHYAIKYFQPIVSIKDFYLVGTIHVFSYFGLGLVLVYLILLTIKKSKL